MAIDVDDWRIAFADFGEAMAFTDPAAQTLRVIVDMPTERVAIGKGGQLFADLPVPQVLAMDADVASKGIVEGSYGVLRGRTWRIAKLLPTGDGVTVLSLGDKQEAEEEGDERTWR